MGRHGLAGGHVAAKQRQVDRAVPCHVVGWLLVVGQRQRETVIGRRHEHGGQTGFCIAADGQRCGQVARKGPRDRRGWEFPAAVVDHRQGAGVARKHEVVAVDQFVPIRPDKRRRLAFGEAVGLDVDQPLKARVEVVGEEDLHAGHGHLRRNGRFQVERIGRTPAERAGHFERMLFGRWEHDLKCAVVQQLCLDRPVPRGGAVAFTLGKHAVVAHQADALDQLRFGGPMDERRDALACSVQADLAVQEARVERRVAVFRRPEGQGRRLGGRGRYGESHR